jgi:DNA polymerase-3 subunit delta'
MAFKDFPNQSQGVKLLQSSLERGRLGHAYLFTGNTLEELESVARTFAKAINCLQPVTRNDVPVDCCDRCPACLKIDHENHPDVHWVRPESKSRIVTVDQMRELMKAIQLKPNEAKSKVAVIVAADRLRVEAANAFLKTLEEPPPRSVLILLSTDSQRILETILSRCLRLNFSGSGGLKLSPEQLEWLKAFSEMAAGTHKSLLSRYRLMDVLLGKLTEMKAAIEQALTARSPLQRYPDAEKDLVEKWEAELAAAVEAEYRRQRTDLLAALEWWLRDIWLETLSRKGNHPAAAGDQGARTAQPGYHKLLNFPELPGTLQVAQRISAADAMENLEVVEQLQRWLGTNVQEALALEVGLLKLRL